MTLSGCSSDGAFPAVHDMPAARTETKLTTDEINQATKDLLNERDRTEAQGQTPVQPQTAATTGSGSSKKKGAQTQPQAQQPPISISAYAKQ